MYPPIAMDNYVALLEWFALMGLAGLMVVIGVVYAAIAIIRWRLK